MTVRGEAGAALPDSGTVSRAWGARGGLGWATLALVGLITVVMVSPQGLNVAGAFVPAEGQSQGPAHSVSPAPAVAVPRAAGALPLPGTSAAGEAQLQSAEQSLREGQGPAEGRAVQCSASLSSPTTASCSSAGVSSGPEPAGLAAATPGLGSNLDWQVQGVPKAVGYINFAMTWDYADNYVVLFGGSNESFGWDTYSGETWTYASGVWKEVTPLISPEGRDSSGLAYSPWDDAVLLFGGYTPGTGGYLNDTWLYKAGAWTQMHVPAPTPRNGFGLVYDPALDADLLFGGESAQCAQSVCNDTWLWESDTWVKVSTPHAPSQRWQMSMAYDAADADVIMFGGLGVSGACFSGNVCGDTWQYNASAGWVQVPTNVLCGTAAQGQCPSSDAPSPRHEASMAYDVADGYVLLFGGWNTTSENLGDTWEYNNGVWTKLAPSSSPTGRNGAALTFDGSAGDGYLLLVGGTPTVYTSPDAIWAWSAGAWSMTYPAASVGPGASLGGSMAYDAADGYTLFFGGTYFVPSFTISSQTWKYADGTWTELMIPGPPANAYGSMAYDPSTGSVLLFGGFAGYNETWGFSGGSWTFLCGLICDGSRAPSPREGAGFAYDQATGAMVLFGGYALEGSTYEMESETWAFFAVSPTAGYWINFTSYEGPNVPHARAFPGMTWDQYDGEIVLFGGGNTSGTYGDTWTMTNIYAGWSQVGSCGGYAQPACSYPTPYPDAAAVFVYDSLTQAVELSGGVGESAFGGIINSGTYFFRAGTWSACTGATCDAYWYGLGTFNAWGASAFDARDGYTITSGGEGWFESYYSYVGTYYVIPYSWVFGPPLLSEGPGFSPEFIDAGQPVTFSVGATGGGYGSYTFSWNGLPNGCAPSSPSVASFTCNVPYEGFAQYGSSVLTGETYYDPSVEVFDSSGSPSVASPQSNYWLGWLQVALDPGVVVDQSTTVADVGQTVYFGLNVSGGWGPYTFGWADLPPGCVATVTGYSSERETCTLTSASVGTWYPQGLSVDSTSYRALSPTLELTVDSAPATTPVAANTAALDAGQTLALSVSASGGEGPYTYSWSGAPAACLANAPVLSCAVPASEAGRYTPSVTIRDGTGATVVGSYSGTIVVSADPTATAIVTTNAASEPTSSADAHQTVTFTLTSTPGSGRDTVVWSGLPTGCTPSTTNSTSVTCAPTGTGTFSVSATLNDSNGIVVRSPSAELTVSPALLGGTVAASTLVLDTGQTVILAASFSGGSGDLTYVWSDLPGGCVGSDSATLDCSPTTAGRTLPAVVVTDANGATLGAALASELTVFAPPTATVLSVENGGGTAVGTVTTGTSVSFALTSTPGSGGDTVRWSGLPVGCSPATANSTTVACTPNAAGTYTVTATVTDSNGVSATSPVATLIVNAPAAATPFATPVQYTELGLLGALLVIGVVAVLLAVRRPPAAPAPLAPYAAPSKEPEAASGASGQAPGWKES